MERRAYPRYALQLDALCTVSNLPPQPCTVRNFCLGGLFIAFDAQVRETVSRYKGAFNSDEPLEISFGVATEQGQRQQFQVGCKVARVTATGVGVSFTRPDPVAIATLHRLAMQYANHGGQDDGSQATPAALKTAPGRKIMEACSKAVSDLLTAKFNTLFTQIGSRLVTAAGESKSNVEQTTYFDAITELNIRQAAISEELPRTLMSGFGQLGTFRVQRKDQHTTQELSELSLVDKDAFEDFLAVSEMISRAEERFLGQLTELENRLTRLVGRRIESSSNPVGPAAVCHAFGDLLEGLNVAPGPMKLVYGCFENEIVQPLGKLYEALNRVLQEAGIAPAERQSPPSHRPHGAAGIQEPPVSDGTATANLEQSLGQEPVMPEAAYGAQPFANTPTSGPAAVAGAAPRGGGGTTGAGYPAGPGLAVGGAAGPGMGGPQVAAAGPGMAGPQAAAAGAYAPAPVEAAPGQVVTPGMSPPVVDPRGSGGGPAPGLASASGHPGGGAAALGPGAGLVPEHGHEIMQAAYLAAQTLLGLQRQVGAAGIPVVGGAAENMAPEAQQALPAYQTSQIVETLSTLQRQEQAQSPEALLELDRSAQLHDALNRRHAGDGPRRIGEREADVLSVIGQMFEAIVQDDLLPNPVKRRMVRLHTPLQKVALLDDGFFREETHPARQVLNQMARLETGFDDEGTWAVVDPAVRRIVTEFDDDVGLFKEVVDDLDQLLHQQSEVYEDNLTAVIAACEDQQAFIKSREKAEASKRKSEDRGVPEEWREWLNRARRIKPGAAVAMKVGNSPPQRLTLAWVGEDYSSFVFVDSKGKKSATLTLQELAMHLRRGSVTVLPESELSVVDRSLYSMLHGMHEQLEQQATHDQLTGLMNRRAFEERVAAALKTAIQEHEKHVVCWLAVDGFADISASQGPEAGDALLESLSVIMRQSLGDDVSLARLDEHEFGALLAGCSPEDGYRVVESLRGAVEKTPPDREGQAVAVTVSAGLIPLTNRVESVSALLEAAHAACHAAQDEGGNRIKAYQAGEGQVAERKGVMEWVSQINKTLSEDRVQLRCQRVQPLRDNDIGKVQYEIFLGLRDDQGVPVPTAEFLEAAEYYNQMPTLDRWLIKNVFSWMSENIDKLKDISGCVINLSDPTLSDGQLLDFVMEQLSESRVPPGKICFEVTETAALSTLSEAEQFIRTMTEFGCRFSLDDFGGGDKSYSYLKTLPVDFVKINGTYIKNIANSAEDYAVVKSVNEIAHFMGKRTIAEFVESEDAIRQLLAIGVDFVQGYWIEEPVYLEELDVSRGAPKLRQLLDSGAVQQPYTLPPAAPPQAATGAGGSMHHDDQEGTIQLD
ncbi:MAG: DUF1631 family protein [Gammaproteobacteria bacterium]|nr:DUF1631 family protein [Gammaproteobacteria bacterium]